MLSFPERELLDPVSVWDLGWENQTLNLGHLKGPQGIAVHEGILARIWGL